MFRVIIVDDEPLVRLALRELIDWEQHQCEVVAEASDGKEALQCLKRDGNIDLVVIDIQMSRMNGIGFLEALQTFEIPVKPMVVVLSAYPDYEYVRKAFLLGAVDYIVKTNMEQKTMNAVIQKVAGQLLEEHQTHELRSREEMIACQKNRESLLIDLLQGNGDTSSDNTKLLMLDWMKQILNTEHVLISVLIEDRSITDEQTVRFLINTTRQVLDASDELNMVQLQPNEFALLIFIKGSLGQQSLRAYLANMLNRMMSQVKQYLNVSLTLGVAESCKRWELWPVKYQQALSLAQLRFFEGGSRIYYTENLPQNNEHSKSTHSQASTLVLKDWNRNTLLRQLELGERWEEEFAKGIEYWRKLNSRSISEMLQRYKSFLWALGALLNAKGFEWQDVTESEEPPFEQITTFITMIEVHAWLYDLVNKIAKFIDPRLMAAHNQPRLVDRAKKFIEQHYNEPISLTQVSKQVGVSESYLSKQFLKETGEHFTTYLSKLRVNKAIEMLWSGMKLFEIAERIGYPNQGHFSRIFKKVTGRTPQEYREDRKI